VEDQNAAGEKAPLSEWLRELNQRLSSEGALASEQAFSRGCSTSLVPAGLLVGVAFLLGARHWVSLLLVALAAGMLALAWAAFAATQAQRRSIERVYLASVLPEIEQDLPLHGLTLEQIRQAAKQALPEPSPLGTCLEQLSLRALKHPGVEHGE
jgi:hypothetical protein